MPDPMALVLRLSDKWLLKKPKFQGKSSIIWGKKALKWHGTYAAVLLGSHSTPTPCFRTLCLNFPLKKLKNTIITQ